MANFVDGKIVVGVEGAPLVDVLRDVAARNAARERESAQKDAATNKIAVKNGTRR
jgi:hypothetical protein